MTKHTPFRFLTGALLAGALALGGHSGAAAKPKARAAGVRTPQLRFTDYRLKNGLRVLLAPDHSAPVVALSVTYDVGSRNERPGRSGFAHLFEHMMFQGSQNVGKREHSMLILDAGGTYNGTTNQDRTNYYEAVPSNQLEMILFLEADRMRALDVNKTNLDNQRAVVQEEKRQSYENQPYGRVYENLLDLSYAGFAYKHTTIGSMEDLDAASLEDIRAFFKTYYAPNNASLALVGDFEPQRARKLIQKYFGSIPRQPAPPPVTLSEPSSTAERRRTLNDPLARLPAYFAAYRTVSGNDPDYYPLALLDTILGQGRTSRLYPALVEKQLAVSVSAGQWERRGPGLFLIQATLAPSGKVEEVEAALDREIARIQSEGVTEAELEKVKTQARASTIGGLQTALGKANALSMYSVFYGDPNRINSLLPRFQAVTTEDLRRVARKYLVRENRAVLVVQPAPAPAGGRSEGVSNP